jgi:hypothetical protein
MGIYGVGMKKLVHLGSGFFSSSRSINRRIVSYVTVSATQKTDKKTSQLSKLFLARSFYSTP